MASQVLYDLSPALRLMAMGLVVALGPLAWVWLRNRQAPVAQRLRVLTWLTLFLTFDLVLFGAFTRLTDSGLGCPDWPGCYGQASPLGARMQIEQAQQVLPDGPVTHGKAWVEMIHRYLATGVGVLILVLAWTSWQERHRIRVSPWWPAVTLVWVCLQGAFGALTVTMKLFPAIVTLHLLGGLGLLALLRVQVLQYDMAGAHPAIASTQTSPGLRALVLLVAVAVVVQVALGGWVSTNYAVLACTDFPTCQGRWWPDMDLAQGFALWRELGESHTGEALPFAALTAIHYVHRLSACVVFLLLGVLAWRLWSRPGLERTGRLVLGLALWQLVTGLSNVILDWPLVAAVAHTGGAAALVTVLTGLIVSTRAHPVPVASCNLKSSERPA